MPNYDDSQEAKAREAYQKHAAASYESQARFGGGLRPARPLAIRRHRALIVSLCIMALCAAWLYSRMDSKREKERRDAQVASEEAKWTDQMRQEAASLAAAYHAVSCCPSIKNDDYTVTIQKSLMPGNAILFVGHVRDIRKFKQRYVIDFEPADRYDLKLHMTLVAQESEISDLLRAKQEEASYLVVAEIHDAGRARFKIDSEVEMDSDRDEKGEYFSYGYTRLLLETGEDVMAFGRALEIRKLLPKPGG
jgi:hypothetical protein